MRIWAGLLLLLCLISLSVGQWCFSGFLASNPERDLLSFVPVGNATTTRTVWTSSPKTILATDVDPTKRYLYLISTDLHHQAYELEKYSLENGVQIQSRVLSVPAGALHQGVPFCVSSSAISLFYSGALHRFSLATLEEQRQNLPPLEDQVWLACSANTTFVSAYERNQVWFVDANGQNGFMTETPLFIPSPTGLFYEPESDILFVASGRPLIEVYSYSVGQAVWLGTTLLTGLTNDTVAGMQTSDINILGGVVLTTPGALIQVVDGSEIELGVQNVLPSNDADEFFTVGADNLISKTGDWNNKGNLGNLDYISIKPCVSNMEKMFLKSNQSLGLFRISSIRGEAIYLDGFDLDQGSNLLSVSGSCTDPLFWWTDENLDVHVQSSQTGEETPTTAVYYDSTSQLVAYDETTWCFVGGQDVSLACFGLDLPDVLLEFQRGHNQRIAFLSRNVLFAMWDDMDNKGVYSSVMVSSNWTRPVWLAPTGQFLEMERIDEWMISFRTNMSGIFLVEPGQDRVFYFSITSQLFPYPMHDQGLGVCLNFTSIILPVEPPTDPQTKIPRPDFIGSLPLFVVSVIGMTTCCTACVFLACFLSFYKTKRALFKSANFRYRQQKHDPERQGEINMRQQFGKHVRSCMWGCLGRCNKNWRDKAEIRMQDRQYDTNSMRSHHSSALLLEADDFRDPRDDGEEMMDNRPHHDPTAFDTIPLERVPSSSSQRESILMSGTVAAAAAARGGYEDDDDQGF